MAAPVIVNMRTLNVMRNYSGFLRLCRLNGYGQPAGVRGYAVQRNSSAEIDDCEFRVLVIPGHTKLPEKPREARRKRKEVPPPRYKTMIPDQDWTNVWPAAQTFKWSAVPFPVRQGMVEGEENDGIVPGKYANAELMKIPNFLHLTPPHIKKHCRILKEFCTEWPAELDTDEKCVDYFPIEVVTSDYIADGASIRDARARTVTLTVPLSKLELDDHALDKIKRLAGDCYDPSTDILTLTSERCPLKKQNYDFLRYLLTALYHESWKVEDWEASKTLDDMEKYIWYITPSRKSIVETLQRMKEMSLKAVNGSVPEVVATLPTEPTEDDIVSTTVVENYKTAVSDLHNIGEDLTSLENYKLAVKALLLPHSRTQ